MNRKLLMPYLTGGLTPDWADHLRAFADAGADLVEVGLPFSDPTLDGATVQEANAAALARGATARGILDGLTRLAAGLPPLVVSTYSNLALRDGFTAALGAAGVTGLLVPDLPLDEADALSAAAAGAGVDLALLAAPSTPPERLAEIGRRSRGFVYAVSLMGTTGERAELSGSAATLVGRIRAATDLPVLLGFGVSTPAHAAAAARCADGVIVGAAVVRRVLDGAGPSDTAAFLATMRRALDELHEFHEEEGPP
ncbi:tryptophan synthase subunit alpha [Virgisporangium ochraceum]|uniref:Tryptophan synthase alpha chain n=1 Tax=Virgisporangium ochraceum TaxID=65505 RepID=A0A8J4EAA2_9ACTN|nr:tryptophan synthase subunit alpha [Virgisporangium ochraceum]GIJ67198.1 tryptophan synthase alpha chain [Virgisporangium ochraceum]